MNEYEFDGEASGAASEVVSTGAGGKRLQAPLGQGPALQRWLRQARQLRLPHGFLVTGARGIGKTTVIDWITAALLCPSDLDAAAPCGVCRTCTQVANRRHADVHVLDLAQDEREHDELKKSYYVIKVDQVRAAQAALQRHAVTGRARVLVIQDADYLEEEGQNALLKTLEEPGAATFLLLETTRPEQLLPTVNSRAQRLGVLPLPNSQLEQQLRLRVPQQAARFAGAVAVANGSLGLAQLACTEQAVQLHDLVRTLLADPKGLRPVAIARAVLEQAKERRFELAAARTFLWLLRSEVRARCQHLAADPAATYVARSAEPWTTWLETTLHAERDLDLLIPSEQVLTACLVQFRL